MRIIIVDDEAYLRDELKDALERVSPNNEYEFADGYDGAMKLIDGQFFDIAFLDIQMPGKNGLTLAEKIKKASPKTNIVMVTAYSQYALDALKLFVSGYILKPISDDELRTVLSNLRTPIEGGGVRARLEVKCFGNFEAFTDGKPMRFKRSKEKEMLAYLICLKGASANRNEICANIFEDATSTEKAILNFKTVVSALKKDLQKSGFCDILIHSNNSYSINTDLIKCDYYDYITGNAKKADEYHGEFMNQYSWAEEYIYALENY